MPREERTIEQRLDRLEKLLSAVAVVVWKSAKPPTLNEPWGPSVSDITALRFLVERGE